MSFLKNKPVFLFLLPVFFVLHGFTDNYDFVPVKDALLLILVYTGSSFVMASLFWLLYRNPAKASLIAFLLMSYNFFFGSIKDLLRKYFEEGFIGRYSFILPVSFLFFIIVIIWLKKRKKPFQKITSYLNFLLLLLIIIDTGWLSTRMLRMKNRSSMVVTDGSFIKCDTCKKPDIFFILLDEYAGHTALKEGFNFDNTAFETGLSRRGFQIISDSRSNYNSTPVSMASILNMDYLNLDMKTKGPGNLNYCYRMIRDSRVLKFLTTNNYKFYNYSIFNFTGQPRQNSDIFLPVGTRLITSQTFLSRLWEDFRFNVITGKPGFKAAEKRLIYSHLHNNENFIRLTLNIAAQKSSSPKFVYTHLMMPHYPFYFDSKGVALPPDSLVEGRQFNKNNYLEYLQYCNKKILEVADDIIKISATPPVIILLSDHGYRYFQKKEERRYCFMNFAAVYFPDADYNSFYDSMSAVNLFRVIFNNRFQQHYPILKDSTIYLWE